MQQIELARLQHWLIKWKINVNSHKKQAILTGRNQDRTDKHLNIDCADILWAEEVTYLVKLDRVDNWKN